jgi:pectin methylesterase-like acyl-CoA thioesterase/pectate lyase
MSSFQAAGRWLTWAAACVLAACAMTQPLPETPSTPGRPQLAAHQAASMQPSDYLAEGPSPWAPGAIRREAPADFTIAADGSGSHRTVQAAIDAVPARSASGRRYTLRLKPGVYRETVCVKDKAPITLLGEAGDASAVVIVEGRYNALPKRPGIDAAHPCHPDLAAATHGTPGSATMIVASEDFEAADLTVANDAMAAVRDGQGYPPGVGESGGAQGVALTLQADRVLLDGLRLLGHQDTLHARRPSPGAAARVLVRRSLIAGDVDFIFGSATLVIDDCSIQSRGGRRTPGHGGHVLAPSTPPGVRLGFLVVRSRFVAEPGVRPGSISLGRAWDEGVARGTWQPGVSPNGQALVRESLLGPHIGPLDAPWSASTSRRPFSASGEQANRFAEFGNTRLAPAARAASREVLPANDGWAAAAGGTTGGALALPGDVHTVSTRAELAAALRPHAGVQRPRIVQVAGRIDLSVDDAGRPLGFEDYRDPAFDWAAYARAYDPATWGRRPPSGLLEDARLRSLARQNARVVMKLPPHTTLVGITADAAIVHGKLLIENVDNLIVRHLHLSDAHDHFPAWDPNDNTSGEWNSELDNLTLRRATHVWIDHCDFDDADHLDSAAPRWLGKPLQHHDGLLDIIRQSDWVTVSWNRFRQHDKTTVVGNSDRLVEDEGRLRVSFHHNLYEGVKERTPRVRFGRVHVQNNLFVGRSDAAIPYGYSIGVGQRSRVVSEANVWETSADIASTRLVRLLRGSVFTDLGSWHNGQPVDLLGALRRAYPGAVIDGEVGWRPTLVHRLDRAEDVAAVVRAGAGAGVR